MKDESNGRDMPMIKIKNLCFSYPDGTEAVKNISIAFPEENIFAIMGQSGSGKTTLLNCIARFLIPQKGAVLLNGRNIKEMGEKEFRKKVGVVFQQLNLFPHLTVLENMTLAPCKVQGKAISDAQTDAMSMLERLGIPELRDNYPSQVSGGQAQRAAIARGLMLSPQYMLLDEPTSSLDARTGSEFAGWLRELHEDTHFIIVTHDLLFAEQTAARGVVMRNGEFKESGEISAILKTFSYRENTDD